ncbi:glycosyltransferase family 4 protein [Proteus terrae]|uniref:glycosyltransferase family 4 protein n=1 Tax=Proteus terrae TaxID=1574161 RepID=UPI001CBC6760|nr:glycosyltransferase [Proteus terrae]UAX03693.1 glycosyltransferase [Proteus terrae subsp. cibarius]
MVIFVGPKLRPITGQSLSFDTAFKSYDSRKKSLVYGGKNSLLKIVNIIYIYFLYIFYLLFYDVNKLYITTNRSRFGFLKDFAFIITASIFNVKVVNHLHGADFKSFRKNSGPNFKKIIDYLYSKIDISIVLLPNMKEQYDMYPNMEIRTVPNCCITSKLDSFSHKNISGPLEILYLSNVMYSKGIIYLIEAVDRMINSGIDVTLSVAGNFMADEFLEEEQIKNKFLKLIEGKSYINYYGPVYGEEKNKLLVKSNVFVLPTFYQTEAQPISIIEAMYAGCTIITTNHNYLPDMVSSDNGFVVPIMSSMSIFDKLKHIHFNRDILTVCGGFNEKEVEAYYGFSVFSDRINDILH